jgi:hypothetical protein
MPLSSAEKQARWRERHIMQRRNAQRVANLLVRQNRPEGHVEELAGLMRMFLNREDIRGLRRALKPITNEENDARLREDERVWCTLWLQEHPGRTAREYDRLVGNAESEVWDWRRAKGYAGVEAERRAWERDHPGQEWPEHMCNLSDRELTDYQRWERRTAKKATRARPRLETP